jgi:hypothetical protein
MPPFLFCPELTTAHRSRQAPLKLSSITQSLIRRSSFYFSSVRVASCDVPRNFARHAPKNIFAFA